MANKKSDSLYRLVHSLTKAEKRYFRIYSSRHIIGNSNAYMILFNAIERQRVFDEEALIRSLKKYPFSSRLSILKNRLSHAILRSLDAFHTASDPEFQARRLVESTAILYRKGLYEQCRKILTSAAKIAQKHRLNSLLLDISIWEQKLAEKNNYERSGIEEVSAIASRGRQALHELDSQVQWWNLKSALFLELYRSGKIHNTENLAALQLRIEAMPPEEAIGSMSPVNRFLYHQVKSAWYFAAGDYGRCYPHLLENLRVVNKNRSFFKMEQGLYIALLANAIYAGVRCGDLAASSERLSELRRLTNVESARSAQAAVNMFAIRVSTELVLMMARNEAVPPAKLAAIEQELKTHENSLSQVRKAQLYFNLAALHLISSRPHEALRHIHKLTSTLESQKTADIYAMAQMLGMVIHIELGNYELLQYSIRSMKRLWQSKNCYGKLEQILIEFASMASRKRKLADERALFVRLADDLEPLRKDNPHVFEFFDFVAWAKRRISAMTAEKAA